ncbi:unnamed protein product [Amoebophrya sp. A25]|nr:unnamed protein product [Amoebophrya sp. A25]|eukprot:GSA25T00004215001.1
MFLFAVRSTPCVGLDSFRLPTVRTYGVLLAYLLAGAHRVRAEFTAISSISDGEFSPWRTPSSSSDHSKSWEVSSRHLQFNTETGQFCAPSNAVNSCFADHCGHLADPTACKENGGNDPDCCGLSGTTGCKSGFFHDRQDKRKCHFGPSYSTCCYPSGTVTAAQVVEQGLYDGPEMECKSEWCDSPGLGGTKDCWAGSDSEPCTCTQGKAQQLPDRKQHFEGKDYYEYTCCEAPPGYAGGAKLTGEKCGDYNPIDFEVVILVAIMIGVGLCVCCIIGGLCFFCAHQRKKRKEEQEVRQQQMQQQQMQQMGGAQAMYGQPGMVYQQLMQPGMQQPMQPGVVYQQQPVMYQPMAVGGAYIQQPQVR